jgi:hypothetical protein
MEEVIARFESAIATLTRQIAMQGTDEYWQPLANAIPLLQSQGSVNRTLIDKLIRLEILPVDNIHVRNVGNGGEKPRYELNIPRCAEAIKEWKSLEPHERRRIEDDAA